MKYIERHIEQSIVKASRHFPALILTGPRRAGKTTLLRHLFPKAAYVLMEDPDIIARVRSDPNAFLDELKTPAILDEIQNVPELFRYIRTRIDRMPNKDGEWLLTGSQEAPLMKGVTESMAGRAAVFQLLPFSLDETSKAGLLHGGFPEILEKPGVEMIWFRSYIQTYLERDVRAISTIRDLATFRRFLSLVASRCGQILNKTELAAPLGVSVPTITQWLSILEVTGQIILVPPFFENFGKRLVKSPKLYFVDSGLACHLLGIDSEKALGASVFLGPVFEGFAASEIVKAQLNTGKSRALYYFRDKQGLEVDFIVPLGEKKLALIEAKATKTPTPEMGRSLLKLAGNIVRYKTQAYVLHRTRANDHPFTALCPDVQAIPVDRIRSIFEGKT
ncbi:MAG TPA: ATP-binding protein [Candidatus Hydrogenedentes bacterium]|nr:ATP-binding protein [Candidatus Hydrogenedentota bacterium]